MSQVIAASPTTTRRGFSRRFLPPFQHPLEIPGCHTKQSLSARPPAQKSCGEPEPSPSKRLGGNDRPMRSAQADHRPEINRLRNRGRDRAFNWTNYEYVNRSTKDKNLLVRCYFRRRGGTAGGTRTAARRTGYRGLRPWQRQQPAQSAQSFSRPPQCRLVPQIHGR